MKLLTATEARDVLRIDHKTLIRLIQSGKLPAFRIGVGKKAPYRISEKALQEYIARESRKTARAAQ